MLLLLTSMDPNCPTVMVTWALSVHPTLFVAVTAYAVVDIGDAMGLAIVVLERLPLAGVHVYTIPEPEEGVACNWTGVPATQMVVLLVMARSKAGKTAICTSSLKEQPALFCTVTV